MIPATVSSTEQPLALAAIDVGTNAARLKLAHWYADGRLVPFLKRRAPIRPGEGVFTGGEMAPQVVARLVTTLREFMQISSSHGAHVRAVATSSLRSARNSAQVQAFVEDQAGIHLQVISGEEEARLICLGVLQGRPPAERSLVVDIGGGSTEIVLATGEQPQQLWSLPMGTVRFTDRFGAGRCGKAERLARMRKAAWEIVEQELCGLEAEVLPPYAYGSSGTIKVLAGYAGPRSSDRIDCGRLGESVQALAAMKMRQRRERFQSGRADIIVAGAVILEAVAQRLALKTVVAVEAGLRDGLLVAMARDLAADRSPLALMGLPDSA